MNINSNSILYNQSAKWGLYIYHLEVTLMLHVSIIITPTTTTTAAAAAAAALAVISLLLLLFLLT